MDSSKRSVWTSAWLTEVLKNIQLRLKELPGHGNAIAGVSLFVLVMAAVGCDNDELDAAHLKHLLGGIDSATDMGGTLDNLVSTDAGDSIRAVDVGDDGAKPPGSPFLVRATIEEEEVIAGTKVAVQCTVEDASGNSLDLETDIDSQIGYVIDGTSIVPTKADEYDITCSATGMAGLEQLSDHLLVTAGPVASVTMQAKPDKQAYQVEDKVEVSGIAVDQYANPLQEIDVSVVAPAELKEESDGKYTFLDQGIYTFQGKLPEPNDHVSGELSLVCDESGPIIQISTPKRAATVDGNGKVEVKGNVQDALCPTVEVSVNEVSTPVDAQGNFLQVLQTSHGMNLVEVIADDGFGNRSEVVQSVYYSSDYIDYSTGLIDDVLLEQSLVGHLGQNFLDDGDHNLTDINDMATLVELLIDGLDLGLILPPEVAVLEQEIPDLIDVPAISQMGFELSLAGDLDIKLYVEDISFAEPYPVITARDGGIDMNIAFMGPEDAPGVLVETLLELTFDLTVESLFGGNELVSVGVSPSVSIQSSVSIEKLLMETEFDVNKNVGEELDIKVSAINVVPSGFHLEPVSEDTALILGLVDVDGQGVIDLGTIQFGQLGFVQQMNEFQSENSVDAVLNFVVPGILDLFEPLFEDQIPQMMSSLFNQFEIELAVPITLQPGADGPLDVTFKTGLSSVHFHEDGGALNLRAGFMAPKALENKTLGSLLRAGCLSGNFAKPEFDEGEKMGFAGYLDLLNELLFALWWTGGLQLGLDEAALEAVDLSDLGISNISVDADFLLPPILTDCFAQGMVEVQVGDLAVTTSFSVMGASVTISAFVSVSMDSSIIGKGNELGLEILGISDIGTQIAVLEGDLGPLAGMLDVQELVEAILVPLIVEQVSNQALASFPIPELDLSTLVPGIPPGTTLSPGTLDVSLTKGYLLLSGE